MAEYVRDKTQIIDFLFFLSFSLFSWDSAKVRVNTSHEFVGRHSCLELRPRNSCNEGSSDQESEER